MRSLNTEDPQFRAGLILANFDGCEGGDLLSSLVQWAKSSRDGYGYAMSDKTEHILRAAVQAEIDAQIHWLKEDGHPSYSEDEVKAILDEVEPLVTEYKRSYVAPDNLQNWLKGHE